MTKVLVGVAAIIIVGGGIYYWTTMKAGAPSTDTTAQTATNTGNSLQALVVAGKPVQCSYEITTEDGTHTVSTIYIANDSVRSDSTSNTQAGTIESHMIAMGGTSYVWTNMSNTGFKSTTSAGQTTSNQSGPDYNTPADYHCSPWSADQSKFNLPSNISFTATGAYTPPSQGAGATGAGGAGMHGTAAQCAQCDGLSSAQKAQCLAALSC